MELHNLCFELDINYESLSGDTIEEKARELVEYCYRRGHLIDLVERCQELRPQVEWPDFPDDPSKSTNQEQQKQSTNAHTEPSSLYKEDKKDTEIVTLGGVTAKQLNREIGDRFLREKLSQIVKPYNLPEGPKYLSIILLDIDDLSIINKMYGLKVGDSVLATVARIVRDETKASHYGRCGDDTFYALLEESVINEARNMAENLCARVIKYQWSSLAFKLRVSCSIGIAQLGFGESAADLVIRASIGMLEAKRMGKNRVVPGPEHLAKKQSRDPSDYYS